MLVVRMHVCMCLLYSEQTSTPPRNVNRFTLTETNQERGVLSLTERPLKFAPTWNDRCRGSLRFCASLVFRKYKSEL